MSVEDLIRDARALALIALTHDIYVERESAAFKLAARVPELADAIEAEQSEHAAELAETELGARRVIDELRVELAEVRLANEQLQALGKDMYQEQERLPAELAAEKERRERADAALAQALIDWADDRAKVTADRDRLVAELHIAMRATRAALEAK